jgi:branched-chain amino acid transport system substrate-binding protein
LRSVSINLLCTALLLLAGCAAPPAPKPAGNEIVVAVAGPMSGELAPFGEQLRRGAAQAVADVNAAGGLLGRQVKLVIGDDQCDPVKAVRVAEDLVRQKAVFVDGHFCSGSSIPASQIYAEAKVVQMSPASTSPWLTEAGIDTLFRITGRDDYQGAVAGTWLAQTYAGKRVAVLDDDSAYGRGLAAEAERAMRAMGHTPVWHGKYAENQLDFSALIAELKTKHVEALYIGGYHTEIGRMVRQARLQGFDAPFFGGDALNTMEFVAIAGAASDGVMFTNMAELRNIAAAQPAITRIRAGGFEPEGYTLAAYAAIDVWAQAVKRAGTLDAAAVAAALRAGTWETAIGRVGFDLRGDLTTPNYVWYRFQSGGFSPAGS